MLQNMRDGASRWVIWVVIILVIIALSLWGVSSYFSGGDNSTPVVAKVDGEKITQTEFTSAYNRLRQARPKLFTVTGASDRIKQELLQQLITQKTLSLAAEKQGFAISDTQLNTFLVQIPAFQVDGKFSQAQFSMVLNRAMFTPQQFMQSMHDTLLTNQVRNGIVASAFALPVESDHYTQLLFQHRALGYLVIATTRFTRNIKIAPQQIKAYYAQHPDAFKTPEKVKISYIEVSPEAVTAEIKITTAALKQYYEDNRSNYTTPARWHVAHILLNVPKDATEKQISALKAKLAGLRKQLNAGVSFAKLAKENSDDILTLKKGGEMPWFTAGTLGPIFEHTVVDLKLNEVSQPVQTRYGVELIKLLAMHPQKIKSFQTVEKQLTQAYLSKQLATIMPKKNDDLANVTFENPDSLQLAAKKLNVTVKTTQWVTQAPTKTGITANANVIATAFSEDVLQQGNNSKVLTLKDGTLIVLRVSKHTAAAVEPLTVVQNKIKQQLIQEQAEKQAMELGNRLRTKLTSTATALQLAKRNGLTWVTKKDVTRQSKGINPLILQQAFNMGAPLLKGTLTVSGLRLLNGDYALVAVGQVLPADMKSVTLIQRDLLARQFENFFAQAAYNAYTKTQTDKATVKKYTENIV